MDADPHLTTGAGPVHPRTTAGGGAFLLLGLALVAAMGSVAIDLYIPSMPRIGAELGVEDPLVQMTLTSALIGFAIGQIMVGPIIDRFGRRRPLLIASGLLILTAIVCAAASTVTVLTGARLLQGMACSAGTVVATATVRDLYEGRAFIRAIGHILAVTAAVPILAPSIGGLMLGVMSWRMLFVVIAVLAAGATAVYLLNVPETARIVGTEQHRRSPVALLAAYPRILRDRRFLALTVLMTLVWGGATWTYVTNSTFVLQSAYGLSEIQFGLAFGINAMCGWIGVQIGSRLSVQCRSLQVVACSTFGGLLATFAMWLAVVLGAASLIVVGVGVALLYLFAGVMTPHISQLSLERLGADAGAATALPGSAILLVAAIVGPVTGMLGADTAIPMTSVMLLSMTAAAAVVLLWLRPGTAGAESALEQTRAAPS